MFSRDIIRKDDLIIYNPSKPSEWKDQRVHEFHPHTSCFATADVNMLLTANIKEWLRRVPQGMYPGDWITQLFSLPEVDTESKRLGVPVDTDRLWYSMHEFVLNNIVLGKRSVMARYKMPIKNIIHKIIQRKPVVIGGKFTRQGHMVCACGIETTQQNIFNIESPKEIDLSKITNIIIDDSYGNYFTGYRDTRGNDVRFPFMVFDELTPDKNCIVLI